ncbi:hypothetical protein PENTCL1PPCAC_19649, partial [Pristionchus entomophagus]
VAATEGSATGTRGGAMIVVAIRFRRRDRSSPSRRSRSPRRDRSPRCDRDRGSIRDRSPPRRRSP